jgi:NADH:ubiquinone oxidoreductase subunit B-like Fe-S oxidoreductase
MVTLAYRVILFVKFYQIYCHIRIESTTQAISEMMIKIKIKTVEKFKNQQRTFSKHKNQKGKHQKGKKSAITVIILNSQVYFNYIPNF